MAVREFPGLRRATTHACAQRRVERDRLVEELDGQVLVAVLATVDRRGLAATAQAADPVLADPLAGLHRRVRHRRASPASTSGDRLFETSSASRRGRNTRLPAKPPSTQQNGASPSSRRRGRPATTRQHTPARLRFRMAIRTFQAPVHAPVRLGMTSHSVGVLIGFAAEGLREATSRDAQSRSVVRSAGRRVEVAAVIPAPDHARLALEAEDRDGCRVESEEPPL